VKYLASSFIDNDWPMYSIPSAETNLVLDSAADPPLTPSSCNQPAAWAATFAAAGSQSKTEGSSLFT